MVSDPVNAMMLHPGDPSPGRIADDEANIFARVEIFRERVRGKLTAKECQG